MNHYKPSEVTILDIRTHKEDVYITAQNDRASEERQAALDIQIERHSDWVREHQNKKHSDKQAEGM